jgi:pimeloyl-ACP methyl ester carboxylesterase
VRAAIRGAKLIELSGAGHLANLDRSDVFSRTLEDFLETV